MPWCPVCRYEYEVGITRCPEDNVELVDEKPPEPKLAEAVEVYRSSDIAAVDAVAAWLAEHGQEAEIVDRPPGTILGGSPAFAVMLPGEAVESIRQELDAAIDEIEAELELGGAEDEDEEEEDEDLVEAGADHEADDQEADEEDEEEDEEEDS